MKKIKARKVQAQGVGGSLGGNSIDALLLMRHETGGGAQPSTSSGSTITQQRVKVK
jgi:hypothetical protein